MLNKELEIFKKNLSSYTQSC
ncbi:hypothetical protein, partial [Campylobacter jejuni]